MEDSTEIAGRKSTADDVETTGTVPQQSGATHILQNGKVIDLQTNEELELIACVNILDPSVPYSVGQVINLDGPVELYKQPDTSEISDTITDMLMQLGIHQSQSTSSGFGGFRVQTCSGTGECAGRTMENPEWRACTAGFNVESVEEFNNEVSNDEVSTNTNTGDEDSSDSVVFLEEFENVKEEAKSNNMEELEKTNSHGMYFEEQPPHTDSSIEIAEEFDDVDTAEATPTKGPNSTAPTTTTKNDKSNKGKVLNNRENNVNSVKILEAIIPAKRFMPTPTKAFPLASTPKPSFASLPHTSEAISPKKSNPKYGRNVRLTTARIVRVVPPVDFLLKNVDGRSFRTCPVCAHQHKNGSFAANIITHLGDHPPGTIIDKTEYAYVDPSKNEIYSVTPTEPDADLSFNIRFHCPKIGCRYHVVTNRHFEKLKFLKQHFQKVHSEKIFPCGRCSATFSTLAFKLAHERTCGLTFKCDTCESVFSSIASLQTHVRRLEHSYDHKKFKKILKNTKYNTPSIIKQTRTPAKKFGLSSNIQLDSSSGKGMVIQNYKKLSKPEQTGTIAKPFSVLADDIPSKSHQDNIFNDSNKLLNVQTQLAVDDEVCMKNLHGTPDNANANLTTTELGYRNLRPVHILPKPTECLKSNSTSPGSGKKLMDTEAQTDASPCSSQSISIKAAIKRRHSASTQTRPSLVSIDTQTTGNRRRRSGKCSASIETQTRPMDGKTQDTPDKNFNNDNESNNGNKECAQKENTAEKANVTVTEVDNQNMNSPKMLVTSKMVSQNSRDIEDKQKNGTSDTKDAFSDPLSSVLRNDMSTSPMHLSEELYLFPDLLGSDIETQTDFGGEIHDTTEAPATPEFTNRETQTLGPVSGEGDVPFSQQGDEYDVFFGQNFNEYFLETADGETQTIQEQ